MKGADEERTVATECSSSSPLNITTNWLLELSTLSRHNILTIICSGD